jgi:hypothetical protein
MRNLDEELKIVQIKHYEQIIKQSKVEIEKLHQQLFRDREQRKIENERYYRKLEEERKQNELESERMQRESDARIAKYEAERKKLEKDTRYYPQIVLIIAVISAVSSILGPTLVVFLTKL